MCGIFPTETLVLLASMNLVKIMYNETIRSQECEWYSLHITNKFEQCIVKTIPVLCTTHDTDRTNIISNKPVVYAISVILYQTHHSHSKQSLFYLYHSHLLAMFVVQDLLI